MSEKKRLAKRNRRHLRQERSTKGLSIGKGSAVALALGLGLAVGAPAEAGIVYQFLDITLTGTNTTFLNYPSNNPSPGVGDQFVLSHFVGPYYKGANVYGNYAGTYVALNSGGYVARLTGGQTIPGSAQISSWTEAYTSTYQFLGGVYYGTPSGPWLDASGNGKRGFVGLSFQDSGSTYYGWAQLEMADLAASLKLIDCAYNDVAGAQIEAGQVPLPGSLLLLATGAVGLLGYRRLRRGK